MESGKERESTNRGRFNPSDSALDSEFERRLYDHWLGGSGEPFRLTTAEFQRITKDAPTGNSAQLVSLVDGTQGWKIGISTYNKPEFNFGIGSASVVLDTDLSRKRVVGFYDFYNFNSQPLGQRSVSGEAVTRLIDATKMPKARDFPICYGKAIKGSGC